LRDQRNEYDSDAAEPITALTELKVTGAVAGFNHSTNDSLTVADGATSNTASGNNYFPDLGSLWTEAEFNVFGDGNEDQAVFNSGATIGVRTEIDYGGMSGPGCEHQTFTGESNNLTLVTPPFPSSMPGRLPRRLPALVFQDNSAPSGAAAACAPAGYQQVVYVDGNSHAVEAFYPLGQSGPWWNFTDISAQAGATDVLNWQRPDELGGRHLSARRVHWRQWARAGVVPSARAGWAAVDVHRHHRPD
jgi:hypothetical protein